jgi:hypothetical protein
MSAPSKAAFQPKQFETQVGRAGAAALPGALTTIAGRPDDSAGGPAPASAQELTQKFEAYLKGRRENRRRFAQRAGVSAYTLSRLFPKRSNRKREFFSRRTLQALCRATEGHITWRDFTSLTRPFTPRKRHQNSLVAPDEMTPLTRKFEAYLESQNETRVRFAERLGVTGPWLSHVFPINPKATPRRLGIEAALRFCRGTEGYLTLTDFHQAGLCPAMEEVIQHSGVALGLGSGRGEPVEARI